MITITLTHPLMTLDLPEEIGPVDLPPLFEGFRQASRSGVFVVLTDASRLKASPRAIVAPFSDGIKMMPELRNTWLGNAVVVDGAVVRFVLSTLLMVAPMPTNVKAFDQRSEALTWCEEILRKAGIRTPPGMFR